MAFHLQVPRSIYDAMLAHARAELPNECVGILAGKKDGLVVERYPLVNSLASPRRFESEARSLFEAERRRREQGLEFLAVYHSHPTSPPVPSGIDTDPEVNFWVGEEIVSLIISLSSSEPLVKGYWLVPHGYSEAEWEICSAVE
jgi:proteasome lid subunit RPN8/RPN11